MIVNFYSDADHATAGGLFSRIAYDLGMTGVPLGWTAETNDELSLVTYANTAGPAAAENDYAAMRGRPVHDMAGWTTFLSAYQAAGFPRASDDPGFSGPFAYDTAGIIIAAMDRADSTDPVAIRNEIAATVDYVGVVGTYQGFDIKGDVIPQWVWLERYQDGQWTTLNPGQIFLPIVLRSF